MIKNVLLLVMIVLFFVSCSETEDKKADIQQKPEKSEKKDQANLLQELKAEYAKIDTVAYLEAYIEKVIMNGSSGLGFPGGDMQAGFADASDAKKIAHYAVTLSGKHCSDHEMAAKAQMYYTSNCGGCHGNDGKGLNGSFPDLTKDTLLGIQKRKEYLESEIKRLEKPL